MDGEPEGVREVREAEDEETVEEESLFWRFINQKIDEAKERRAFGEEYRD